MKPIRVAHVDDYALMRACIRTLCESLDGITVVAEAADRNQALEMVKVHRPDLVLMDISMKTMNGFEATAQIKREFPQVRVIILSSHAAEYYVQQALAVGAEGYVLKHMAYTELRPAITTAMRGEFYLSPQISKPVAQASRAQSRPS